MLSLQIQIQLKQSGLVKTFAWLLFGVLLLKWRLIIDGERIEETENYEYGLKNACKWTSFDFSFVTD